MILVSFATKYKLLVSFATKYYYYVTMKNETNKTITDFSLENFIPYRLAVLAKSVSTAFSKTYAEHYGISISQWRVMAAIGRESNCTASSIVEHTAMDKVQVSRAVSGLIQMGVLKSKLDKNDRRNNVLSFTPQGQRIYNNIVPTGREFEEKLMSIMDSKELKTFDNLLKKLSSQVKKL